ADRDRARPRLSFGAAHGDRGPNAMIRKARRGLVRELRNTVALSTGIAFGVYAAIAAVIVMVDENSETECDTPERHLHEARNEVGGAILLAAPLGVLLAVAGATLAAQRTLAPLQRVIDSAASMTTRELNVRLPLPAAENEV